MKRRRDKIGRRRKLGQTGKHDNNRSRYKIRYTSARRHRWPRGFATTKPEPKTLKEKPINM